MFEHFFWGETFPLWIDRRGLKIGSMDRWTKGSSKGAESGDLTQERPTIQVFADNINV